LILEQIKKIYVWMGSFVHSPYAAPILGLLFYIEAIFFVPTEPMLAIYCLERKERAFFYATIATIASVLGALTMYMIGSSLWHTFGEQILHNKIVNCVITPHTFTYFVDLYGRYAWWTLLATAIIPIIPFKAATFTAGFCHLAIPPFICCAIISRGIRFFMIAAIMTVFSKQIKQYFEKYFPYIMGTIMIIVIAIMWWRY
jgi:membrane protein YqaA with SNARE-associated domain